MNGFTATVCQCRYCKSRYYEHVSRADYKGYCTAKCYHAAAKQLGYRKGKGVSEYEILRRNNRIGSVVIETRNFKSGYRLPK